MVLAPDPVGGRPRPPPPGRRIPADGAARALAAIEGLAQKYPGRAVAIVTHGDICAAILGQAARTPLAQRYQRHDVPLGSVSEMVLTDRGWHLLSQGVMP
ncbi:MAG: hypothetical protein C4525_02040 [Desulfarculus sp.]|nr:MAG: hypothetical protein C4525_02040 [Desulfarculus sp.]